jgi:putative FmdB family regulatory protein
MPTYEYKCEACGHAFEKFQTMSSAPVKVCPECGKKKVKRLIGTGAGLIFKGSGFYITDYRDKSYADKAKADNGSAAPSTTSGDSTPATSTKSDTASTKTEPASTPKAEPAPVKAEAPAPAAPKASSSKKK